MSHPLVRLTNLMNWDEIERSFGAHFASSLGRPALSPRLVAGLLYLQHANDASDEAVVATWLENPYWQYFCGQTYVLPIDPSSLSRWRKRVVQEGVEVLLAVTIEAARAAGLIKKSSLDKIIVDTTVMPKAIAHPTDSRLLEKSRQHLVKLSDEHHLALRHNYNRQAPRMAAQIGRYPNAKQYNRMRRTSPSSTKAGSNSGGSWSTSSIGTAAFSLSFQRTTPARPAHAAGMSPGKTGKRKPNSSASIAATTTTPMSSAR